MVPSLSDYPTSHPFCKLAVAYFRLYHSTKRTRTAMTTSICTDQAEDLYPSRASLDRELTSQEVDSTRETPLLCVESSDLKKGLVKRFAPGHTFGAAH